MVNKYFKVFLFMILLAFVVSFVSTEFVDDKTLVQNVTDCGILNTSNALYTLNQSINTTGWDCLAILNDSIVLDCAGHNITLNSSNEDNYSAVLTLNFNNITVKNCVFLQNFTGSTEEGNEQNAISFVNSTNSTIFNNTFGGLGFKGSGIFLHSSINANITANTINNSVGGAITLFSGSNSSVVENNNITAVLMGINIAGSPNTNVSSNNITSSSTEGVDTSMIRLEDSDESIIDHNIIITSDVGVSGIVMEDVLDVLINLNTITTSGEEAFGIYLNESDNANITLNNITTSGYHGDGINLQSTDDSVFTQNIVQTGDSDACVIHLDSSPYNNTFYNNIFNTSTNHSGTCLDDALMNIWNTTEAATTNILGRANIGGNFWTNNASTGYSDLCLDEDGDYICDNQYNLTDAGILNVDYLPLANHTNMISGCDTLDVANETYALNQSVTVSGTCFNITANNVTLNFVGYNITGNGTGYGINVSGNDTTVVGETVYNFSNGIYINASSNNAFTDLIINNSAQDAILLEGATSDNNNFTNITVTDTNSSYYDINFSTAGIDGTWIIGINFANYTFTGAGGKVNFKEPSYGEIKFIEAINGNGTSLQSDVDIGSNWVFVNSSSNSGLNKSANISLYDISYTNPKPQYSSGGTTYTDCTSTTDPVCVELSYSTSTDIYIFSVSHFTYFKSAEGYTAPADDTTGDTTGGNGVVEVKETHSWTKITPGVAAIMKDFDKEIGIKQIQIEVHTEAQDVKVIVIKYSSKPANVSVEKSGKVHQYLQIEVENLEDKLDKAVITMRVNKSWVSDNSLEEDDIALFKFNESEEWEELTTTYTESDDDYYYYDVELTSFSYFVIGEKEVEPVCDVDNLDLCLDESSCTGAEGYWYNEVCNAEEAEEKDLTWLWIIIGIIVLAAIIGGGIAVKKRRQQ